MNGDLLFLLNEGKLSFTPSLSVKAGIEGSVGLSIKVFKLVGYAKGTLFDVGLELKVEINPFDRVNKIIVNNYHFIFI